MSTEAKFEHMDIAEKQKVLNECVEAEAWLREKQKQQETLPKYATPVLLSADIKKQEEALDRPIMTKPKPAEAAAPASPSQEGSETQQQSGETNANAEGESQEAASAESEPMKTEKAA